MTSSVCKLKFVTLHFSIKNSEFGREKCEKKFSFNSGSVHRFHRETHSGSALSQTEKKKTCSDECKAKFKCFSSQANSKRKWKFGSIRGFPFQIFVYAYCLYQLLFYFTCFFMRYFYVTVKTILRSPTSILEKKNISVMQILQPIWKTIFSIEEKAMNVLFF